MASVAVAFLLGVAAGIGACFALAAVAVSRFVAYLKQQAASYAVTTKPEPPAKPGLRLVEGDAS